uniref:Uncharacterized protein n=1 Tax=Mycena chlorophos TaxID=658473 RepID=A0ABQ0LI19_MYCCL|nr:predicted protein [Mycena chlorophos]
MGLLGHVIGGAVFGLTARFWQLGILKRPMLSNPAGHVACTVGFAGVGYYWWKATVHMEGLLEQKEEQLRQRRAAQRIRVYVWPEYLEIASVALYSCFRRPKHRQITHSRLCVAGIHRNRERGCTLAFDAGNSVK